MYLVDTRSLLVLGIQKTKLAKTWLGRTKELLDVLKGRSVRCDAAFETCVSSSDGKRLLVVPTSPSLALASQHGIRFHAWHAQSWAALLAADRRTCSSWWFAFIL